ncbi:hypothetical protein D9758_006838 [Tetrapyrgos nigripes]|uniref:Major facilitator superfamily (MFS) profile domain-containing protein n=1 Tax=Tetrapyrgos nigripes TaxID=182062 RepID=A0A8H5CVD3_9AGAR|nr:hypothetical protein D9758_006838 [Tetrapyrgos nigripes]
MTTTGLQPIIGRVSDIVGPKRLLLIELWIFIVGSAIAGASPSLEVLVAGRLISGAGGAGILSLTVIILSDMTHERQRGNYLNLINLVFIIADSVGPIIGTLFANSSPGGWRWIFLFCIPFGPVITAVLWKMNLPNRIHPLGFKKALQQADIVGMTLLVASLSFLVVGLNLGGQVIAWASSTIIRILVAAAVSISLFAVAEIFAAMPIAPMYLFCHWKWRNIPVMLNLLLTCAPSSHRQTAALLVIPFLFIASVAGTIVNHVAAKLNRVHFVYTCTLLLLPVGIGLMSTLNENSSLGTVAGYSLLTGVGFGSGTQISMLMTQIGLPQEEIATVTALSSTTVPLGGVLGVGLTGAGLLDLVWCCNATNSPCTFAEAHGPSGSVELVV